MDQFSQDPFTDLTAEEAAAQRAGGRDSLMLSATIRVAGRTPEGEVRGIGWVSGRVAWVTDGRIGIAFDRQIDPLLARKPVVSAKATSSW